MNSAMTPAMITTPDRPNQRLRWPMISHFRLRKNMPAPYAPYQTGLVATSLSTTTSTNDRVTLTAVSSEKIVPTMRVNAKPLTVPVPSQYSTPAPTIVVTCESNTVVNARLNPTPTAARVVRPAQSSSLMRSKISTFASTAMPMESTNPAIPGN